MCLAQLNNPDEMPNEMEGWKVVGIEKQGKSKVTQHDFYLCQCLWYPPVYYTRTEKYEEWIRAGFTENIQCGAENKSYKCGFHIFQNKDDAIKWTTPEERVVKVKCRKITAIGTQRLSIQTGVRTYADRYVPAFVAQEIYVEKPKHC